VKPTNTLCKHRQQGKKTKVMDIFLSASRSILNKVKSQIYVWTVSSHSRISISQILGFSISNDWKTFKYLGLPLCLKPLLEEYWKIILQKIKEKMDSWGKRWINLAGKVVIIILFMSSLPPFQFSSLLVPKGVLKDMAQLIHKLL
jgi:hypothetical protein